MLHCLLLKIRISKSFQLSNKILSGIDFGKEIESELTIGAN